MTHELLNLLCLKFFTTTFFSLLFENYLELKQGRKVSSECKLIFLLYILGRQTEPFMVTAGADATVYIWL